MIANDSLSGEYGRVVRNQRFVTTEETATSLESRGLAFRAREPRPSENKMISPSENKADDAL